MAEPPGGVSSEGWLGDGGRQTPVVSASSSSTSHDGPLDLDGVPEREGGKRSKEAQKGSESVLNSSRRRSAWAGREGNMQQQGQEQEQEGGGGVGGGGGGGGLVRGVEDASAG